MRWLGVLTVLALLLGACGGGSSGPSYDSAKAVAAAFGCDNFKTESPELYAADAGSCSHHGHYTAVQWFKSSDNLASWLRVAEAFGGAISVGLTGSWNVTPGPTA
jgi:hypothetical protein